MLYLHDDRGRSKTFVKSPVGWFPTLHGCNSSCMQIATLQPSVKVLILSYLSSDIWGEKIKQ